jgi:hypothetical protein
MPLFRRPDGRLARDVPPFRRIMPYIMRTRNEAAVYLDREVDLTKTLAFIEAWNRVRPQQRITVFHLFLYASVQSLHSRPRLNRFVVGGRIYERDGIWISYSTKKSISDDAPIVAVKRKFDPAWSFEQMVEVLYGDIRQSRTDEKNHVDKELGIVLRLPGFLLKWLVKLQMWADSVNLLPGAFIHNDPLYSSLFIANLGSLKMDSAFHHLYEYGNIPLFAAIGRTQTVPYVDAEGKLATKSVCHIKFTLDERVEDGLYGANSIAYAMKILEDPAAAGLTLPQALPEGQQPVRLASGS